MSKILSVCGIDRGHRRHIGRVKRMIAAMFDSEREDDRIWNQWLSVKREDSRGVRGILASDVRDVFKARAIAISLSPAIEFMPFEWNERPALVNYLSQWDGIVFSDLSPRLRDLTIKLIEINVDAVVNDGNEELRDSLYRYNRIILQVLASLDDDDSAAKKLFDRYHLNDPTPFRGMDESSGYNPFLTIICSPVSEKWKVLADERMRETIRLEEKSYLDPRCEWEGALKCYASHIQLGTCIGRLPYSLELFASQLEFMLELKNSGSRLSFDQWHVRSILTLLGEEKYDDLRHRFARFAVFEGGFEVVCDATYLSATLMRTQFGDRDMELRERLNRIIAEGKERMEKQKRADRAEKEKVDSIIQKMR